jgi:hypothetical protein
MMPARKAAFTVASSAARWVTALLLSASARLVDRTVMASPSREAGLVAAVFVEPGLGALK